MDKYTQTCFYFSSTCVCIWTLIQEAQMTLFLKTRAREQNVCTWKWNDLLLFWRERVKQHICELERAHLALKAISSIEHTHGHGSLLNTLNLNLLILKLESGTLLNFCEKHRHYRSCPICPTCVRYLLNDWYH